MVSGEPYNNLNGGDPIPKRTDIVSGLFPNKKASDMNGPLLFGANGQLANRAGNRPGDGATMPGGMPELKVESFLHECQDGCFRIIHRMGVKFSDGKTFPIPEVLAYGRGQLEAMLRDVKAMEKKCWKMWIYEYYEKHQLCPQCREKKPYDPVPGAHCDHKPDELTPENYKDITEIKCDCGWRGSLDSLVAYES